MRHSLGGSRLVGARDAYILYSLPPFVFASRRRFASACAEFLVVEPSQRRILYLVTSHAGRPSLSSHAEHSSLSSHPRNNSNLSSHLLALVEQLVPYRPTVLQPVYTSTPTLFPPFYYATLVSHPLATRPLGYQPQLRRVKPPGPTYQATGLHRTPCRPPHPRRRQRCTSRQQRADLPFTRRSQTKDSRQLRPPLLLLPRPSPSKEKRMLHQISSPASPTTGMALPLPSTRPPST